MPEDLNTLREALALGSNAAYDLGHYKDAEKISDAISVVYRLEALPPRIMALLRRVATEGWEDEHGESLADDAQVALSRLEAAAAAEYERGRQDGMKQEHALWQMQRIGQEIEAAAVPGWNDDPSAAAVEVAKTVMSDCGLAVEHRHDLLGRIASRIQRFASLVRSVPVGEVPDGWVESNTLPPDGTPVLLRWPDDNPEADVPWRYAVGRYQAKRSVHHWWSAESGLPRSFVVSPSHWRAI